MLTIDPAWRGYEDYLAALGAKYRPNAKDQMRKLAAAGWPIEPLVGLEPHVARLHQLYLAIQENASLRLVTVPETHLPALARAGVRGRELPHEIGGRCGMKRRKMEAENSATLTRSPRCITRKVCILRSTKRGVFRKERRFSASGNRT